ncbi:protein lifeguard 2-like isoform X2 [Amphibalanus amphitrite]|nr:protein lifeguard 2-like isoform X2 [Amphibalanus amphitrite]
MDHGQADVHVTTNDDPKDDDVAGFGSSFSSKAIRHAFIRKVYLILTLQLSFTLGMVALFTLHHDVKLFVQRHQYIYWASYGVFLVTYITLMCCGSVRRKHPWNLILLTLFTAAFTYMVAMISSFYNTYIVLLAVGLTAGICLLLTLFAVQTKYDFTGCGMFLCVASLVVVLFGIVALIIGMFTPIPILQLVYAGLIALLFSMYLVYDTQQIVGGRKHEISAEEHIYGAIVLYIDIMQIFLALLQLVGSSDN